MPTEENKSNRDAGAKRDSINSVESMLRTLLDSNGVGYTVLSEDGIVLDANHPFTVFSGHTRLHEVLGHSIMEWFAGSDRMSLEQALGQCLAEGHARNVEVRYTSAGRQSTDLVVDASWDHTASSRRILAVWRDVTACKREEMERYRVEQFRSAVLESSPFTVYEYDDQLRMIRWNKRSEELTGYSADELYQRSLFSSFDEEEVPRIAKALEEVRSTGHASVEAALTLKDGRKVPYYFAAMGFFLEGKQHFAGIGIDLTTTKVAEKALRESEERLRTLIDQAPVPIGVGRGEYMAYANPEYVKMLRAERAEQIVGMKVLDQFAPQSRERVLKFIREREQGLAAPKEYETVGLRLDGTQFPVHVAITRVMLSDGAVTLAFATDITDRIKAQEELRVSESRYRRLHNALIDGFVQIDMDGSIREFNESYREMLGYTADELNGLKFTHFTPEKWHKFEQDIIESQIRVKGYSGVYEKEYRKKDGTVFPVELRAFLLKNEQGENEAMCAIVRDITERKRAQEDLARVNEQLRVERETLKKKNIAFQELLTQVSEGRQRIGAQIQSNIESIVLPILDRLAMKLDPQGNQFLAMAQTSLKEIVTPFVSSLESHSRNLTQRDIELCELIRRGHGSKEIAELRGCSIQTIIKQRKIIRKKLGIAGKDINLAAYLGSLAPTPSDRKFEVETKSL